VGVYAGPEIANDGLVFSIDGRNIKSFPRNGKIISSITREEKNTTSTQQDGYIYSNYGYIDKFTNFSIENSSVITINLSIDNTSLKSGTAFSICSDTSSFHKATGVSSYSAGITTTVSTATTSYSLNLNVSGISSYNTGITTTVSTATTSHSLNLNVSGISSYNTGITTTFAEGLYSASYHPEFELSFYLEPTSIKLKNKSSNHLSYLNFSADPQKKNIYSVVYRTFSTNSTPISLYQNGVLVADSNQQSGSSQFENVGISLFNIGNSHYSQYGIRFINVYSREMTEQELLLINNLKTN